MESLAKLFGGKERVKMMRMFLLNPERVYTPEEVAASVGATTKATEQDVGDFERAGLIRRRPLKDLGKERKLGAGRRSGFTLDPSYLYLRPLQNLVVNTALLRSADLIRRLSKGGHLRLVIISGVFIQNWDSRIDLLVVGDKIKKSLMDRIVHSMESEIGRELHYAVFEVADFEYRQNVGDKLIRDIFDFPHHIILDKIGIKK